MPIWIVLFICVVVAYFAVTEGAKKYFDTKVQVLFNLGLYQDCIDLLDRGVHGGRDALRRIEGHFGGQSIDL